MNPENIILISFGQIEKSFLDVIASDVQKEFQIAVKTKDGYLDLSDFFDPARRQYDGTSILKKIDAEFSSDAAKTIGLFKVDLFINILTYIFGQAFLNGRSGIASMFRLYNERYGMNRDDELLLERFSKEVIHELGHTFGLIHCHVPACVMMASTYVEDIDQKSNHLCTHCKSQLEKT